MHHHFTNNYYAYHRVTTGAHNSAYAQTADCSRESPTTELINLIVLGMMITSPFIGALLGGLCNLFIGFATEALSVPFIGQTHLYSRVGLGAFSGLLLSVALGACTLICVLGMSVLRVLLNLVHS